MYTATRTTTTTIRAAISRSGALSLKSFTADQLLQTDATMRGTTYLADARRRSLFTQIGGQVSM